MSIGGVAAAYDTGNLRAGPGPNISFSRVLTVDSSVKSMLREGQLSVLRGVAPLLMRVKAVFIYTLKLGYSRSSPHLIAKLGTDAPQARLTHSMSMTFCYSHLTR
jgi:hypothetical protein